jgi:hypothetical protein
MTGARVWTVLAHPWHECYLDALPYLSEPGDIIRTVTPADWAPATGRTEIIFGVARCPETWGKMARAPHVMPYETENVLADGPHREPSERARAALRRPWLNYSRANARRFGDIPLPPRCEPPKDDSCDAEAPIDVLFAGSINSRRARVLHALKERGASVCVVGPAAPVFGAELAALQSRSKLVLNLHYYEPGVFETFRVAPAIARGALVVTESDVYGEAAAWRHTCIVASYENLVETCIDALDFIKTSDHSEYERDDENDGNPERIDPARSAPN